MTAVLEARGLGKRYHRRWALADCDLSVPAGRVVAVVGPNGAGRSTLLHLATGVTRPSSGTIEVFGARPACSATQLAKVGFVAQNAATFAAMSIADHLRLGARLNPRWDAALARDLIERLGVDPRWRAGRLSAGQRAQLALTLAMAKRPELLVLDEPVAALDPLARREFLDGVATVALDHGTTVVLSSHQLSDLDMVCDHLVLLVAGRVRIAGDVDELLAAHRKLVALGTLAALPCGRTIVSACRDGGTISAVVRHSGPIHENDWRIATVSLEELVLAYLAQAAAEASGRDR